MKPIVAGIGRVVCFITIWIFARMKQYLGDLIAGNGFITIWIFARMKHNSFN